MMMIIKLFLVYSSIIGGFIRDSQSFADESNRGLNTAASMKVLHRGSCDPLVAALKLLGKSPEKRAQCGERLFLNRQMTTSGVEF